MNQNKNITGIGTDIIATSRVARSIDKYGKQFLDKMFGQKEQDYCNAYKNPVERFSGRFCAKEAVAKALGCGFGKELGFLDITIINNEAGKPEVVLSKKVLGIYGDVEILLSISHCKEFATATAIATKNIS